MADNLNNIPNCFPNNEDSSSDSDHDAKSDESDMENNIEEVMQASIMEELDEDSQEQATGRFVNALEVRSSWKPWAGKQKPFPFFRKKILRVDLPAKSTPYEIFSLILDDKLVAHIALAMNLYMEKKNAQKSKASKWLETNPKEVRKFIGLMIWMDLVRVGRLEDYWSENALYNFAVPRAAMYRERFRALLGAFCFYDDGTSKTDYKEPGKIGAFIDVLQSKFQALLHLGEDVVVREMLALGRDRTSFKQYIPASAHRHGRWALFKLCSLEGYTWGLKLCTEQRLIGEAQLANSVCMELCEPLLNQGRTVYIDNFHASFDLAQALLANQTHLVGTVRVNGTSMPKDVLLAKLRKGEIIARENDDGVMVLKWKGTCTMGLLSTKHSPALVPMESQVRSNRRWIRVARIQPEAVIAHIQAKGRPDRSDAIGPHIIDLRKGMKWYKQVGLVLLLQVCVTNAWILHRMVTKKKLKLATFREQLVDQLVPLPSPTVERGLSGGEKKYTHHLEVRTDGNGRTVRRSCANCYAESRKTMSHYEAGRNKKATTTFCGSCPKQPQLCMPCFNKLH
uniref:PiggyBac transposable element-derived protein domain-containing protein n=1 Tax=Anopheles coluzzii TaxID=1518534 RepID=A0A8W7P822_ANOCL